MTRLDPEMQVVLDKIDSIISAPIHTLDAPAARDEFTKLRRPPENLPPMDRIENTSIYSPQANIPLRIYYPKKVSATRPSAAMVWYHGGGWVVGDLDTAEIACREIAAQSGCVIISVDYRLAPEHPFPAAFDDSLAALRWSHENHQQLGVDPSRIAIGGDSAGGNLAAVVAITARDKGLPVAFQLLVYPVIDDSFDKASYRDNGRDYFLTTDLMQWFWQHYIANPEQRSDARVAPMQSALTGLPDCWLMTAGFDPLRDEGLDYARALQLNGNKVSTLHLPGTIHGCFTMPVESGAVARSAAASALADALS